METKKIHTPFQVDTRKPAEAFAQWRHQRVADMRRLYDDYDWTMQEIATLYNITRQRVSKMLKNGV